VEANSYLAIALRNIKTNRKLLGWGDYNDSARYSQQVVEKTLKHLLETTNDVSVTKFFKLHNLSKLYSEVENRNIKTLPQVDKDILAVLTDYYYDTNYPGDNFVLIKKEEAERAYKFAKNFIFEVVQSSEEFDTTQISCDLNEDSSPLGSYIFSSSPKTEE